VASKRRRWNHSQILTFDDTVNEVGLANVSFQSFDAPPPPKSPINLPLSNYVSAPLMTVHHCHAVGPAMVYLRFYQWLTNGVPITGRDQRNPGARQRRQYTVVVPRDNLSVTSTVAWSFRPLNC